MGCETLAVSGQDFSLRGHLTHLPLLQVVLARHVSPDAREITPDGLVLHDLSAADRARLTFYVDVAGSANLRPSAVPGVVAELNLTKVPATPRVLAEAVATAGDIMALFGVKSADDVRKRLASMQVRGAARVRAAIGVPILKRFAAKTEDVAVTCHREPYAKFFAVEEYDLTHRRFDGTFSPQITRAVFISGDAVTVLPYDPVRDRVLLIEQFRAGPFARGDAQPWQLEAIAGRIDPGETPQDAARREAVEEAGLTLGAMLDVAQYYPSPGVFAEYLYSYVAITELPDGAAGVFGVDGEAEDIRGHLMGFDDLMALVASGEVANAPLILTAYWLAARREILRAGLQPGQNPSKEG